MATGVLFATGFDYLPDGTNVTPYGWTGGTFSRLGAAYARGGSGKGVQVEDTWNGFSSKPHLATLPATDHLVLQFAYRPAALITEASLFVQFLCNSTTTVQLHVNKTAAGLLQVVRGSTTLGTSSGVAMTDPDAWYYIEIRVKFDGAAGAVEIVINDDQVLSLTSQDTEDSAFSDCTGFAFHAGGNYYWLDDILVRDYSVIASMIGDYRIVGLMPDGATADVDFTPSTGANYAAVDEIGPDDDTTYVESSTVGHKDLYALTDTDFPGGGEVLAVQVHHYAKRADAGPRQIRPVLRHSGNETTGATVTLGASYARTSERFDDVPGGTGWTLAQVDALEVGQEVIA